MAAKSTLRSPAVLWSLKMTRNNSDMAEPAPQRWAIYIISNRGEFLDSVEAPDEASAIIAAIKKFGIVDAEQQKRLVAWRASKAKFL
jgi:hypothetical protein